MNEIQFLRIQLALEHRHLEAVVKMSNAALGAAAEGSRTEDFLKACADYLLHGVKLLEARDRARLGLHYARPGRTDQLDDPAAQDLERAIEDACLSWNAVESTLADLPSGTRHAHTASASVGASASLSTALHRPLKVLGHWLTRRKAAADQLDDSQYSVEDWRRTAFVNAGSIVEERNRYQRVEASLPVGIEADRPPKSERHGH